MGWKVPKDVEQKCLELAGLLPPAPPPDQPEDEKEFSARFQEFFRGKGWLGFHPFDMRKSMAGYPDWTLIRDRAVWVELKTETGRLDAAQETWRDRLLEAGQEWHLFRPSDWPRIVEILA